MYMQKTEYRVYHVSFKDRGHLVTLSCDKKMESTLAIISFKIQDVIYNFRHLSHSF